VSRQANEDLRDQLRKAHPCEEQLHRALKQQRGVINDTHKHVVAVSKALQKHPPNSNKINGRIYPIRRVIRYGLRDTPGLGKSQTDAGHLQAGFRNLSRHIRTDSEDHCFGWSTTRTRMSEFQIVQGAFPRLQFMQCLRAVPRARLRNRPNWRISGEALLMHRHEGSPEFAVDAVRLRIFN